MPNHEHRDKNLLSCAVVLQFSGCDVETLFWVGSVEEIRILAEEIAFRAGADTYRIVELTGNCRGNDDSDRASLKPVRGGFTDLGGC